VDRKFNEELSRASVAAFDEYISIHRWRDINDNNPPIKTKDYQVQQ
jgi:hypothetical protein